MEGSIVFYTYGSTLELYGQQFTAGMLTADLLNLSPDEYRPMSKRMMQVPKLYAPALLIFFRKAGDLLHAFAHGWIFVRRQIQQIGCQHTGSKLLTV